MFHNDVHTKIKLRKGVVYVLEMTINELNDTDREGIKIILMDGNKPVPDFSSVIVKKFGTTDAKIYVHDVRRSVIDYNKLTIEDKQGAYMVNGVVEGVSINILEINPSYGEINDVHGGKHLYFTKFYI